MTRSQHSCSDVRVRLLPRTVLRVWAIVAIIAIGAPGLSACACHRDDARPAPENASAAHDCCAPDDGQRLQAPSCCAPASERVGARSEAGSVTPHRVGVLLRPSDLPEAIVGRTSDLRREDSTHGPPLRPSRSPILRV